MADRVEAARAAEAQLDPQTDGYLIFGTRFQCMQCDLEQAGGFLVRQTANRSISA